MINRYLTTVPFSLRVRHGITHDSTAISRSERAIDTDVTLENADERTTECSVKHGVNDGVRQGCSISHPHEDRHQFRGHVLHAVFTGHRQNVHCEKRCPQYHKHGKNDA